MKLLRISPLLFLMISIAWAESITVYKSPTCGCCAEWVEIMEAKGHDVTVIHSQNLQAVKDDFGLPRQLGSCHTAEINGYIFEGHVPEADIMTFLAQPPEGALGLAVPGMPAHSPGMAKPGQEYQGFNIIQFNEKHQLSLFSRY